MPHPLRNAGVGKQAVLLPALYSLWQILLLVVQLVFFVIIYTIRPKKKAIAVEVWLSFKYVWKTQNLSHSIKI